NYYSVYGGQQFSPYYPTSGAAGPPGMYHNFYPFYAQYAQSSQAQGFGVQYPQMVQYPYLPQNYGSIGILSLPSSMPTTNSTSATSTAEVSGTAAGATQAYGTASEQNSSTLNSIGG
ncbi:hypothetical protein SO802_009707, partial [Lithocarpus litseifolius]